MPNHYTPDRWVVLTIKTDTEIIDKVFAGWRSRSLSDGDSWKLSSGIVDVADHPDHFEFINHSGSVYFCRKDLCGMTAHMNTVYQTWLAETDCEITIHDNF